MDMMALRRAVMIGGIAHFVEDTATGNPCVFTTDLAKPLRRLALSLLPRQSGTGDPSPENIRPIVPWNGLTVNQCGKNLFNEAQLIQTGITLVDGWYVGTRLSFYNAFGKDGKIFELPQFKENTRYTLTVTGKNDADTNGGWFLFRYTDGSSTTVLKIEGTEEKTVSATTNAGKTVQSMEFTYPGGGSVNFYVKNIQLEVGTTATAYEPYKPITKTDIVFPSPVYGGTLDVVSGVLTVEWICYDLSDFTWEEYTTNRVRSSYLMDKPIVYPATPNDYPELIAEEYIPLKQSGSLASNHNGLIIMPRSSESAGRVLMYFDGENYPSGKACFKLATPQTVTLAPTQITALVGVNTVWSDADNVDVTYLKKG